MPNFVKIGETLLSPDNFLIFPKWQPSAILDSYGAFWDDPLRVRGGLYHLTKLGWNLLSSFCNIKV